LKKILSFALMILLLSSFGAFAQVQPEYVSGRYRTRLTSGGDFSRVSGNFSNNSFMIKHNTSVFSNLNSGFNNNSFRIANQAGEFSRAFQDKSKTKASLSDNMSEFSRTSFNISRNEEFAKPPREFSELSFSVANNGEFLNHSFSLTRKN